MKKEPAIFCAVDTDDLDRAVKLAAAVGPVTGGLKLGLEFFSSYGPQGVEKVVAAAPDADLFIDLKFHDIPNTVAAAVRSVTHNFTPAYVNVHASGGMDMMQAAKAACHPLTKLLGVTILTSIDFSALCHIGYAGDEISSVVRRLALLTEESGLDGVVCSAHEIEMLRKSCGDEFVLMVPGIRPDGADTGDQKRIMNPPQALGAGATHLVIGRPITQAPDPARAAADIMESLAS